MTILTARAEADLVALSLRIQRERDPKRKAAMQDAYRLMHELWARAHRAGWRTLDGRV